MLVYFIVALMTGLLSGLARATRKPNARGSLSQKSLPSLAPKWNFFDFVIVIGLVCFSALRFQVGTDYAIYALNYVQLQPGSWGSYSAQSPFDAGYSILTIVLRSVSDAPYLIFWASSILTVLPTYAAIRKWSLDPTLALLLYILLAFYVSPFNAVRQGIAAALNLWAITFLGKRTWLFIVINFLAASFHLSAALAALLQLIVRKWRPSGGIVVTTIVAAGGFAILMQFSAIRNIIGAVVPRYQVYLEGQLTGIGTYLVIAAKLGLLLYGLFLLGRNHNSRYIGLVTVGLVFLVIGTQYLSIARMEMYFGVFLIMLLPNALVVRNVSPRAKSIQKILLILFAVIYFFVYLQNYSGLIPYQTYLGLP